MYVMFPDKMKDYVYMSEEWIVQRLKAEMNDDGHNAREYAEMAARCISHCNTVEIVKVECEVCRNCRAHDSMFEGSKDFDVWISFVAIIENGFKGIVIGGANLTDIWNITGREEFDDAIRSHMYVRRFTEEI